MVRAVVVDEDDDDAVCTVVLISAAISNVFALCKQELTRVCQAEQ